MKKQKSKFFSPKIRKWLLCRKKTILMVAGLGIFCDLFFVNFVSDLIIFFLILLWILVVWLYHLSNKISVSSGLIFLTFCPFFLIFGKESRADKFAVWSFMFLAIGITQIVIEYVKEEKKVSPKENK